MDDGEQARKPHYRLKAVTTPVGDATARGADADAAAGAGGAAAGVRDPFLRPENEDDDGYDPFSDRPAPAEPTFQEDPWR